MAEYINKIISSNVEYEIKDTRVPDATSSDEGKAVVVDAQGGYVLSTPSAGGTKLYKHEVKFTNGAPNQFLRFFCDRPTPFTSVTQIRDYAGPMVFGSPDSFINGIVADGSSTSIGLSSRRIIARSGSTFYSLDVSGSTAPYSFRIIVSNITDTTNFGSFVDDTVTDTW